MLGGCPWLHYTELHRTCSVFGQCSNKTSRKFDQGPHCAVETTLAASLTLVKTETHKSYDVFRKSSNNTSHDLKQVQSVLATSLALAKTEIHQLRNMCQKLSNC